MPVAPEGIFLLDTNVCIGLIDGAKPRLVARLARCSPTSIRLPAVVKAELLYGARNSTRPADNLRLIERFASPFVTVPFDDACAEAYGRIRAELKRRGEMIGSNDLLIAATALAYGSTLVTHNVKEFGRVSGLRLEDWEAEA